MRFLILGRSIPFRLAFNVPSYLNGEEMSYYDISLILEKFFKKYISPIFDAEKWHLLKRPLTC